MARTTAAVAIVHTVVPDIFQIDEASFDNREEATDNLDLINVFVDSSEKNEERKFPIIKTCGESVNAKKKFSTTPFFTTTRGSDPIPLAS